MTKGKKTSARPGAKKPGSAPITSGRPNVGSSTSMKKPAARAVAQPAVSTAKVVPQKAEAPKAKPVASDDAGLAATLAKVEADLAARTAELAAKSKDLAAKEDALAGKEAALSAADKRRAAAEAAAEAAEKKRAAAEAAVEAASARAEKADGETRYRLDAMQAKLDEATAKARALEARAQDAELHAREFEAEAKAVRVRVESLETDLVSAVPSAEGRRRVLKTKLTEMLGSEWPIIQTGMGWVSGAKLTAATSAAGGFGILAAATMTFPELERAIADVKAKTDRPFGVNLRADQADAEQRCDLLIAKKVRVASFAQAPSERLIKKLKDAGVLVIPTIGARRHAEKVAKWGVDAVIAQGQEGGGHTGTVPTSLLVLECAKAVSIPVIGAGGFSTGQGLVAALAYGGQGIAMGTRFLLTKESGVPEHVKAQYLKATVNDTVVTRAIDGHPQRVIRTAMVDELEKAGSMLALPLAMKNALSLMRVTGTSVTELAREGLAMKKNQDLTWAQLAMAANAPMLTKATMVDGKLEAGILPTGQVAGTITELPTVAELVTRIVAEAEATLARLGA